MSKAQTTAVDRAGDKFLKSSGYDQRGRSLRQLMSRKKRRAKAKGNPSADSQAGKRAP